MKETQVCTYIYAREDGSRTVMLSSPHWCRSSVKNASAIKAAIHSQARDALKGEVELVSDGRFYRPARRERYIDRISLGITFDIFIESNGKRRLEKKWRYAVEFSFAAHASIKHPQFLSGNVASKNAARSCRE